MWHWGVRKTRQGAKGWHYSYTPEITDKLLQKVINSQRDIKLGQFTEEEDGAWRKLKTENTTEIWKTRKFDDILLWVCKTLKRNRWHVVYFSTNCKDITLQLLRLRFIMPCYTITLEKSELLLKELLHNLLGYDNPSDHWRSMDK